MARSSDEFDAFWRRVHAPLRRHVRRKYGAHDADDIVQETMIRCYQNWSALDPDREVWPWLVVVARNVATDRARWGARRALGEPIDLTDERTPEEAVCAGEERGHVRRAFALLPAADRAVLGLHHVEGVPTARIAAMTGKTDNAVRQHLLRARRRLADIYRSVSGGSGRVCAPLVVRARSVGHALFRHAAPTEVAACLSAAALMCAGGAASAAARSPIPPAVRPAAPVLSDRSTHRPTPSGAVVEAVRATLANHPLRPVRLGHHAPLHGGSLEGRAPFNLPHGPLMGVERHFRGGAAEVACDVVGEVGCSDAL